MSSVEQRARELLAAVESAFAKLPDGTTLDQARAAALEAIAAALREQPEARGAVDDVTRDAARWRKLIANTKTDHIWHFVLSEEHKEGHDHFLDVIDALPLTAAQQPVQEGGGEDAEALINMLASLAWSSHPRGMDYVNEHMPRVYAAVRAAPPSAPVGDRQEIERVIRELRAYNPAADEHRGAHIHGVWAKELERALAQQPAQAAPGWKLVPEKITFGMWKAWEISNMNSGSYQEDYAAMLAAAPTPPGDDAAGGGHD